MIQVKFSRTARLGAFALAAFAGSSLSVFAQIGSGPWNSYEASNSSAIQWETNGDKVGHQRYVDRTASDGVYDWNGSNTEKFILKGSAVNRIEYRGKDYSSGVVQFQGWLRVPSLTTQTDGVAVAQVFHCVLLKWESRDGGTLRFHNASSFDKNPDLYRKEDIKTGGRGVWLRINVVHDASNNHVTVYVDGVKKIDKQKTGIVYENGVKKPFYIKFGAYDASGSDDETIEWKDCKVWKKG